MKTQDAVEIVSLVLLAVGLWWVYPPLSLIVLGVSGLSVSVAGRMRKNKE